MNGSWMPVHEISLVFHQQWKVEQLLTVETRSINSVRARFPGSLCNCRPSASSRGQALTNLWTTARSRDGQNIESSKKRSLEKFGQMPEKLNSILSKYSLSSHPISYLAVTLRTQQINNSESRFQAQELFSVELSWLTALWLTSWSTVSQWLNQWLTTDPQLLMSAELLVDRRSTVDVPKDWLTGRLKSLHNLAGRLVNFCFVFSFLSSFGSIVRNIICPISW